MVGIQMLKRTYIMAAWELDGGAVLVAPHWLFRGAILV